MTSEELGACVVVFGFGCGLVFWIWLTEIVFGRRR